MHSKSMMQRCYDILDFPMGATFDDAKKAYRDLVSVWHPDRVSEKNPRLQKKAEERLKEINEAFQILSSYYYSARSMPYPQETRGAEEFIEKDGSSDPDPGQGPRRWFPVIILLLVAVIAAGGFYVYQKLGKIDIGQLLDREAREVSEQKMRELTAKLTKDRSDRNTRSEETPTASERSRPLSIITVDTQDKNGNGAHGRQSPGQGAGGSSPDGLAAIDKLIHRAESLLASGQYPESRAAYESALSLLVKWEAVSTADLSSRRQAIKKGMARDEIVYGARGYVYYRNRWIPPEVYRKDFVSYRGQPRHFRDMIGPLTRAADPAVGAALVRRYPGQVIHKKRIECLDLELLENTTSSARFRAMYRWEVWTFNARDNGRFNIAVEYLPESNQWRIEEISDGSQPSSP